MAQNYKPRPADWWTERRIELYRKFAEGHKVSSIKELVDASGKRIFGSQKEIYSVKKAFDNHDDPFAKPPPPADIGAEGKQKDIPPLRGPSFIATVRPRVITLDPRLFILYDLTKVVHPEYSRDEGAWLYEAVTAYYSDHSEEFELGRLFTQTEAEERKDDN